MTTRPASRWVRPLSRASIYAMTQRALGSEAARQHFVESHLRPDQGERILDLGCGPAQIVALLPDVDYIGIDLNPDYLRAARHRFGSRGRFLEGDVRSIGDRQLGRFDAVVAFGLLHHLDDEEVLRLFDLAAGLLGPGGRMATLDGGRVPGQSRLVRWLMERDRGGHVRSPNEYAELARAHFSSVSVHTHEDLARFRYTQVVLDCSEPDSSSR